MCALENKAQKAKREALEALPRIVEATLSDVGYTFCSIEVAAYLVKNGFVEQNPDMKNEAGALATRATQKGIDAAKKPEVTKVSEFLIEDVALPAAKRGGNGKVGNTKYPFDALEVGQSFFIPATAERPNPVKALASTVTSANARYAVEVKDEAGVVQTRTNRKGREVPVVEYQRLFGIRKDTKDGVEGARIGRTK